MGGEGGGREGESREGAGREGVKMERGRDGGSKEGLMERWREGGRKEGGRDEGGRRTCQWIRHEGRGMNDKNRERIEGDVEEGVGVRERTRTMMRIGMRSLDAYGMTGSGE